MKKTLLILAASILITAGLSAQQKVKEKDLIDGTWKLVIDIEEELEEAEREVEEEDSFLGEMILNSVSGLVSGIIEELEIYMEFRPDGEIKVVVEAFGEREIEYSEWHIDNKGRLYISDTDNFKTDDNDYWMMEDGVLISYEEKDGRNENVYLVHVD